MILECFIFTVITFLVTGNFVIYYKFCTTLIFSFANFFKKILNISSTETQCQATEVFAEEGSGAVLPCKTNSLSLIPAAIVWSKANKG